MFPKNNTATKARLQSSTFHKIHSFWLFFSFAARSWQTLRSLQVRSFQPFRSAWMDSRQRRNRFENRISRQKVFKPKSDASTCLVLSCSISQKVDLQVKINVYNFKNVLRLKGFLIPFSGNNCVFSTEVKLCYCLLRRSEEFFLFKTNISNLLIFWSGWKIGMSSSDLKWWSWRKNLNIRISKTNVHAHKTKTKKSFNNKCHLKTITLETVTNPFNRYRKIFNSFE